MSQHEIEVEPVPGLPESLPRGEYIVWQGAPNWRALTREAFNLNWVAGYFALLAAWRGIAIGAEQGWTLGAAATIPYAIMGLVVCAILAVIGFVMARATVYTITNRRVAMRIGAALTVTLNVPFTSLEAADLAVRKDGTGTIALRLLGSTRLSYLVCWPHVRPWRLARAEPALRCIPDATRVAKLLGNAAETRLSETSIEVRPSVQVAAE